MSVIEDTRKLLQDFLAPELRAIAERLDALEKGTHQRFETQEKNIGQRFDSLEKTIQTNHSATMLAISNLAAYQEVLERVAKLEAQQPRAS
jgi:hypothetical protein